MMSQNISVATGGAPLHGLDRGIRATPVCLFGWGTPCDALFTSKVLFSSSKFRDDLAIYLQGCRLLLLDKAEQLVLYTTNAKNCVSFSAQIQLLELAKLPIGLLFLPTRAICNRSFGPFAITVTPLVR